MDIKLTKYGQKGPNLSISGPKSRSKLNKNGPNWLKMYQKVQIHSNTVHVVYERPIKGPIWPTNSYFQTRKMGPWSVQFPPTFSCKFCFGWNGLRRGQISNCWGHYRHRCRSATFATVMKRNLRHIAFLWWKMVQPNTSPMHLNTSPMYLKHPQCISIASPMHPYCIPNASLLHPQCIPIASPMHP